jgi:urease accessory protein
MARLRLTELIPATEAVDATATRVATLTLDERRRSRLLMRLDDGSEAALTLPRGSALRDGDRLRGDAPGVVVVVRAAAETLSVARTSDRHLLTRAAYHLGNRHVPLQIGADALWYEHDHVLDDLARTLGLDVSTVSAPFQPEAGGYGGGRHDHEHGATHGHRHAHGHAHAPGSDHAPHDHAPHDHGHHHDP